MGPANFGALRAGVLAIFSDFGIQVGLGNPNPVVHGLGSLLDCGNSILGQSTVGRLHLRFRSSGRLGHRSAALQGRDIRAVAIRWCGSHVCRNPGISQIIRELGSPGYYT